MNTYIHPYVYMYFHTLYICIHYIYFQIYKTKHTSNMKNSKKEENESGHFGYPKSLQ